MVKYRRDQWYHNVKAPHPPHHIANLSRAQQAMQGFLSVVKWMQKRKAVMVRSSVRSLVRWLDTFSLSLFSIVYLRNVNLTARQDWLGVVKFSKWHRNGKSFCSETFCAGQCVVCSSLSLWLRTSGELIR